MSPEPENGPNFRYLRGVLRVQRYAGPRGASA